MPQRESRDGEGTAPSPSSFREKPQPKQLERPADKAYHGRIEDKGLSSRSIAPRAHRR